MVKRVLLESGQIAGVAWSPVRSNQNGYQVCMDCFSAKHAVWAKTAWLAQSQYNVSEWNVAQSQYNVSEWNVAQSQYNVSEWNVAQSQYNVSEW
jgi:hypothetical protein